MGRDFDGANDRAALGSDASIDSFIAYSNAFWVRSDSAAATRHVAGKNQFGSGWVISVPTSEDIALWVQWSGATAEWLCGGFTAGVLRHVVVTYNGAATGNDPVCFINKVSQTITEDVAPSGTLSADAAQQLTLGETSSGGNDLDGLLGFYCYDNQVWDAAMVNRHFWWGVAPGGPSTVKVWHPFWTSETNNKGTATANASLTGTTMVSIPKVERMWASMMGCGR